MKTLIKILVAITLSANSASLFSQTYTWMPLGSSINNGTNGNVYAVASFNNQIICGGIFTNAGGVSVSNVASYNPATQTWTALGGGINGEVNALFVFNGELYAGGQFTSPGNNIARWNGSSWSALGQGTNGQVLVLFVYNSELIVGGDFNQAGGVTNNNIAKWNGSAWSSLGSGLTGSGDRVEALTSYTGLLVAGGRFDVQASNVAKWNGTTWSGFNSDVFGDRVQALEVFNSELVVGGRFENVGTLTAKYIVKWNGSSWQEVGGGLYDGDVEDLKVYKNNLIVGGNFKKTGTNLYVDRIARWDGASWHRMLTGMNDRVVSLFTFGYLSDTSLYAGGEFTTAGGKWCYHAAVWGSFDTSSVSGEVRYSDNNQPVLSGKAKILRMDVNSREIIVVDSADVINGNYILTRVPRRDSLLRVIIFPDDELLDEGNDSAYVPTYHPSTIQWLNANVLYPINNLTNIDVYVLRVSPPPQQSSQLANISGYVYLNILPPFNGQGGFPFLSGSVLYLKQDTNYLKFSLSDELQHYSITGLNPGTYEVTVVRLGYETETRTVVLGIVNLDTVNFYLDTLNPIGIVNINSNIPDKFELKQNYPNPFNPITKIKFFIKESLFTELKVYNVLGQLIRTLVSENLKRGEYEVIFSAANLPSGVYFYRLSSPDFSETKKMVLIK